jgi:hypothetical protein
MSAPALGDLDCKALGAMPINLPSGLTISSIVGNKKAESMELEQSMKEFMENLGKLSEEKKQDQDDLPF